MPSPTPLILQASPSPRTPAAPASVPLLLSPPGPLGSIISGGGGSKAPSEGAPLEAQVAVEARDTRGEDRSPEGTEEEVTFPDSKRETEDALQEPLEGEARLPEATTEVAMLTNAAKATEEEGRLTEEATDVKEETASEAENNEEGKGALLPQAINKEERLPEKGPGSSSAPSGPTPCGPRKQHRQEPSESEEVARLRKELQLLEQEANSKIAEGNARVLRLRGTVAALARGHWRQRQRMAAAAAFATWRRHAALSSLSLVPYGATSSNDASPAQQQPLEDPPPAAANPPAEAPSPPQRLQTHHHHHHQQQQQQRPPTPLSEVPRYANAPPQGGGFPLSPADGGRSPLTPAASGTGYSSCSSNSRPPPSHHNGPSWIPSPHFVQRQQQSKQQQPPLHTTKRKEEQGRAISPFAGLWETAELDSLERVVW